MSSQKHVRLSRTLIGCGIGLFLLPFTFVIGWFLSSSSLSNYGTVDITPSVSTISQDLAINSPTSSSVTPVFLEFPEISSLQLIKATLLSSTLPALNQELIAVCVNSFDAVFITPDGARYYDGPDYCGIWSLDGRQVVSNFRENESSGDIFFRERGGQDWINLTKDLPLPGWESYVSWSPKGKELVIFSYQVGVENNRGFYLLDMKSSAPLGKLKLLHKLSENERVRPPVWSPDGQMLIYVVSHPPSPIVLSRDGKVIWRGIVSVFPSYHPPSWSPDSTKFVYTAYNDDATADNPSHHLLIVNVLNNEIQPINLEVDAFLLTGHQTGNGSFLPRQINQ